MEFELTCARCNHRNHTSSRFCIGCGAPLERQCPQCMKPLAADANYCDGCGARIDDESQPRSSQLADVQESLERRQMTVMFCDLRDSTRLSEALDPEDLRRVLGLFQDCCTKIIKKYDGYVSRYMGDGILTQFGYPHAHDDDAYHAVRAGIDIITAIRGLSIDLPGAPPHLSSRIGIATGLVIAGDVIGKQDSQEQAIVGKTPNLASRLQSLADTDSIFVNETTYRLVRNRIRFDPVGPTHLAGLDTAVKVYRVTGLLEARSKSTDEIELPAASMVDRETELAHLMQKWRQAQRGNGRVVLTLGEAGIGKSRLIRELESSIEAEPHHELELCCSSYLANSSLHPVFEYLRENAATELSEIVEAIAEKDARKAAHIRNLVAAVSGAETVNGGPGARESNPVELPFNSVIEMIIAISEDKPLLLVLEDFHWADPSTRQLIDLLVDQVPLERVLVVISSRPESRPEWLTRGHTSQLTLDRLNPEDAEAMFYAHARSSPLLKSLCRIVIKKSDGVPLFIEELTKSVLHKQAGLSPEEAQDSAALFDERAVPETLRDSLMARLDQLGEAKVIAQIGSAIGRDFTYDMLSEVTDLGADRLEALLSRLVSSELVFQRGVASNRRFHFKHSLVQDTAYESLLRSKRNEFHRRIAAALEKLYPNLGRSQPELMAKHYALSGQAAKAVVHWNLAAERSLQQSANLEALHHASEGLRSVSELDEDPQRDELLLSLYIHLSSAISGTRGDAVPEVEEIHQKAAAVLERSGNASLAFSLSREMHAFYLIRGPLDRALELGRRTLELAEEIDDPRNMTESWRGLGWTYICHGELEKGQDLIRKSLAHYDIEDSRDHTRHDTIDPGGVGLANLAWSQWLAGKSDTAARLARDAIAQSREIDHPYTLAYAICMGAAVFQCRREAETVSAMIDEAIAVASERDYRYWIAWGTCLKGWAQAWLGNAEPGIEALTAGLKDYRDTGANLFVPHILCMTAEAQNLAGRPAEARRVLDQAAEIESTNQIYFYSAETQRLLAVVAGDSGETEASISHFRQALETARSQRAGSFELRVALSILQSPLADSIVPDARGTLASALDQLGEGQEDADQRAARELLNSR